METIAVVVIVGFAVFLLGVAGLVFVRADLARRFFEGFASSPRAHYGEQLVRLVVGAALIIGGPAMWASDAFRILGGLIVITAVGLMCVPWRWHRRFAGLVIPSLVRRMRWYGLLLIAFGGLLIGAVIAGASG